MRSTFQKPSCRSVMGGRDGAKDEVRRQCFWRGLDDFKFLFGSERKAAECGRGWLWKPSCTNSIEWLTSILVNSLTVRSARHGMGTSSDPWMMQIFSGFNGRICLRPTPGTRGRSVSSHVGHLYQGRTCSKRLPLPVPQSRSLPADCGAYRATSPIQRSVHP